MTDEYKRLCKCPDWAPNAEKINSTLALHQIRTGQGYDGKRFSFCPWCGKELLFVLNDIELPRPQHNHPHGGEFDFKHLNCEACQLL